MRFLKDVNNRFHEGGGISFLEHVSSVGEVDQALCQSSCSLLHDELSDMSYVLDRLLVSRS